MYTPPLQDCSITVYPIGLPSQTGTAGTDDPINDACTDPSGTDFGQNVMRVYYHYTGSAFVIRSILDTPTAFARDGTGDRCAPD